MSTFAERNLSSGRVALVTRSSDSRVFKPYVWRDPSRTRARVVPVRSVSEPYAGPTLRPTGTSGSPEAPVTRGSGR